MHSNKISTGVTFKMRPTGTDSTHRGWHCQSSECESSVHMQLFAVPERKDFN